MSKKAGAVSAETKMRLLQAARNEFAEKGFQKSSLRKICDAADVTTGALYFFFNGKDDLFETVISDVTVPFMERIKEHYDLEEDSPKRNSSSGEKEDLEVSEELLDLYCDHRQVCDIIVSHLSHPAVCSFIDSFVRYTTDHYIKILSEGNHVREIDPFAVQWFSRLQLDVMFGLISHGFSKEEIKKHVEVVIKMLRGAFATLI